MVRLSAVTRVIVDQPAASPTVRVSSLAEVEAVAAGDVPVMAL
jgi:hypothetical protein